MLLMEHKKTVLSAAEVMIAVINGAHFNDATTSVFWVFTDSS